MSRHAARHDFEFFSLGGIIARSGRTRPAWLPWALAAVVLAIGAFWDPLFRDGRTDFILLGLAGYELVIGLTENE